MSINTYLKELASKLIVDAEEKQKIENSINYFNKKAEGSFTLNMKEMRVFGSYDRKINLSRKIDSTADVDIMIIFNNDGSTPQTYLNRVKKFVEIYYQKSDIKQDTPTILLDMNHISFEITPAIFSLDIPMIKKENSWMFTNCLEDKSNLNKANQNNNSMIKPIIRLVKYWNVTKNNKNISSYIIEKAIVNHFQYKDYFCNDYLDYLIKSFELIYDTLSQETYKNKVSSVIQRLKTVKKDKEKYPYSSLMEVKTIFEEL